jgi:DNA-binding NarL/FixJ family response regulator
VLSNQGEPSNIAAAKEAGATGYIVKAEALPSEVVEKVTELLTA